MRLVQFLLAGMVVAGCQQPTPEAPTARPQPSPAAPALGGPASPAMVAAVVNGTGYVSVEALQSTLKVRQLDLLGQERWAELESLVKALDRDPVAPDGLSTRRALFDDNWSRPGQYISSSWRAVALAGRWRKARPSSPAAWAVQALTTAGAGVDMGLQADVWASDGSSSGQASFLRDAARKLAREMLAKGIQPAQAATAFFQVDRQGGRRQSEEEFGQALKIFVDGDRATPNHRPNWQAMARYALPVNAGGGKDDYLLAFARQAAELQKSGQADAGYARACLSVAYFKTQESPFDPKVGMHFDSERVLHGVDLMLASQPGNLPLLNVKAWLTCKAGAWEQARPLFDQIGPNWSPAVWGSAEVFEGARADALRRIPAPSGEKPVNWKPIPVGPEGPVELRAQTAALLQAERFGELDAAYGYLVKKPDRLGEFYAGLALDSNNKKEYENSLSVLERWARGNPKSIPARLALAQLYISYAWFARGGGWGYTVTEEGRKSMDERLGKAQALLQEAADLGGRDPQLAKLRLMVLVGTSGDRKTAEKLALEGLALAPADPLGLRSTLVNFLLPRWHGEPGEAGRYLREEARRTKDASLVGREVAAQVGFLGSGLPEELGFTWPELRTVLRQALAQDSGTVPSALLYLAAAHDDRATAKEALGALKEPDLEILKGAQLVDAYRRWAAGGPLNPLTPTRIVKLDSGRYSWSADGWTPTLVSTSHRIPLGDQVGFGLRLKQVQRVPGTPLRLDFRWEHPEWHDPNTNQKSAGSTHTYHIFTDELGSDGNEIETFSAQENMRHEWIPGTWRVTVTVDGEELFVEEFEIYQP